MEIRLQSNFWTLLRRLTQPLGGAYCVFEADLSRQLSSLPAEPGFLVRIHRGEADLQAAIEALVPAGLEASDVTARLQRGDLVAIGFIGNHPVAYTWASFSDVFVKEIGLKIRARSSDIIQYDTLVLTPFRRRGLQFAVARAVLDYARQHDYTRTLAWVNVLNRASYKNQRKSGKKLLLTAVSLRIPGTQHRWTFSLGAPLSSVFVKSSNPV